MKGIELRYMAIILTNALYYSYYTLLHCCYFLVVITCLQLSGRNFLKLKYFSQKHSSAGEQIQTNYLSTNCLSF